MKKLVIRALYRSPLTVTLRPSSFLKKYGPMIPPAHKAHQTDKNCWLAWISQLVEIQEIPHGTMGKETVFKESEGKGAPEGRSFYFSFVRFINIELLSEDEGYASVHTTYTLYQR
ncbi:hypothetical protein TNCV_2270201 [Trichonephila clavipes]|nr:hypothetical protein TNCV_2270201 [Trichonephila clavipes]